MGAGCSDSSPCSSSNPRDSTHTTSIDAQKAYLSGEEEVCVPNIAPALSGVPATAKDGVFLETDLDGVCCLHWTISDTDQDLVEEAILHELHAEIAKCLGIFGAEVLSDDAVSGFIRGFDLDSANMTAADTMARFGQLLCRWGIDNAINLRTGIARGRLRMMRLPKGSARICYFGEAFTASRRLAIEAEQDNMVHISREAKDSLLALQCQTFISGDGEGSYYLDPESEVKLRGASKKSTSGPLQRSSSQMSQMSLVLEFESSPEMLKTSFEEFRELLINHRVDLSKFGKGHAKTLEEFYNSVVHEGKSFLVPNGTGLERVVAIIRISLRVKDDDGRVRELRLSSKVNCAEQKRVSKLAMILKMSKDESAEEVVEKCFTSRFGFTAAEYYACFVIDKDAQQFSEEKSISETIPGIVSIYRVYSLVVNVRDKKAPPLQKIGLPHCGEFSIGVDGGQLHEHKRSWTWTPVEDHTEDQLMNLLQHNGIDVSEFSVLSFAELYDEVYERKLSTLEVRNSELVRTITVLKLWLHADILNVDHILVMKSKYEKGAQDDSVYGSAISMRISAEQDLTDAFEECLFLRIGITPEMQEKLVVDQSSFKLTEEMRYSKSYPGLKTLYTVNEFHARVSDSWSMQSAGLPSGTDFYFVRKEHLSTGETNIVITNWCWQIYEPLGYMKKKRTKLRPTLMDDDKCEISNRAKRKLPSAGSWILNTSNSGMAITQAMKGKNTDWSRAKRAANKICDPSYTCEQFFDDMNHAFPELRLYLAVGEDQISATTTGRTADDEYQRTMGALFTVFWLMRLRIDGKESFAYGLNSDWKPRTEADFLADSVELEKRQYFYKNVDWPGLEALVQRAGLLMADGSHNSERTLAMLVLMAIHDIMKMEILLPHVEGKVGIFAGYQVGDTIADHDVALSYILMHHPNALPSFSGLSKDQQDAIRFTHCKMEYNMGWLVQAEAPPGALFRKFREVVISGQASAKDIAFYFVHWFTDLAGAEPFPLEGCEKFVLKFPLTVLERFVESFAIVQNLSKTKTETQVFEEYLLWRWNKHEPALGLPPTGKGAVAKMRLVLMAQGDSMQLLDAVNSLSDYDKAVLFQEMAITGCREQSYAREPIAESGGKGPAILVYYGPALLQKAGKKDPKSALQILAEVFRQTRVLWPLSSDLADMTVTVRIDTLKELDVQAMRCPDPGYSFVLVKNSGVDAVVQMMSLLEFKALEADGAAELSFVPQTKQIQTKKQVSKLASTRMSRLTPAIGRLFSRRPSLSGISGCFKQMSSTRSAGTKTTGKEKMKQALLADLEAYGTT